MKKANKRKGIMGGTFNPIHVGHLLLAETAKETFSLDEILFIPSGHSYMKDSRHIAPKEMRLEMTRLAIADNPCFRLSAIEVEREGNTYTFETLLALKEGEPDTEFYFIAGADSLFNMESWKNPHIVFRNCTVLAAVRDDMNKDTLQAQIQYLNEKFDAEIYLLPLKEITISSTDIRNKWKQKKSIRYMVPDQVIDYMKEHHLYY